LPPAELSQRENSNESLRFGRTTTSASTGFLVPGLRASKFPSRLRLRGDTISM
jgi:hypothetical protein